MIKNNNMILKFLWSILYREPMEETIRIPQFYINKRYKNMTRREKREYKRWLTEHDMWDWDVISENIKI